MIGLSAVEDWGSQVGTAFGLLAASVAVFGLRAVMSRNIDLVRAHEVNANLAVENERTRFARDLHDILGHSLTVITVKAELAQRLMDVDPERARAEVADLERLSRDALADVRRAVEGYRDLTLPGELARARTALAAAQIEADRAQQHRGGALRPARPLRLDHPRGRHQRDPPLRGPAAARWCSPPTAPRCATTAWAADDGRRAPGCCGLRERAAALGATVVTRALDPGFSLAVVKGPGMSR